MSDAHLTELLRALAHDERRRLVRACLREAQAAGDLAAASGLAPASVSEHLKVLRKTGLLVLERRGRFRLYRTDSAVVRAVASGIEAIVSADEWGSGYSKTPLPRKLGIKPAQRIAVIDPPSGFIEHGIGHLPDGSSLVTELAGPVDLAIAFVTELATLDASMSDLARATAPDGAFWIAWPKRSSGVPTDMTEDRIRELALPRDLVDTKVCAMSDTWSGLRLCLRRERR